MPARRESVARGELRVERGGRRGRRVDSSRTAARPARAASRSSAGCRRGIRPLRAAPSAARAAARFLGRVGVVERRGGVAAPATGCRGSAGTFAGSACPPARTRGSLRGSRLVDRAQRFRQPVDGAAKRRREPRPDRARDQFVERRVVEVRQIAGEHQPGRFRMLRLRGDDAGNRAFAEPAVDDLRIRARGAPRPPGRRAPRPRRCRTWRESRSNAAASCGRRAIGEGRLVRLHAPASGRRRAPARWSGVTALASCGRNRSCRRSSASRRVLRSTMSCDSDLHMS